VLRYTPPPAPEEPIEVVPEPEVDKWNGLPPPDGRPIKDRWHYLLEILALFAFWFVLWIAYRWAAERLLDPDSIVSSIVSLVMPVVISLGPPILWWKRWPSWFWDLLHKAPRARGLPFLLTRRNLFSSVLVACLAVVVVFILINLSYPVIVAAMGVDPVDDLEFFAAWRAESLEWLVYITFLYMIIVGPVEELYHRGFVQDQVARRFPPWFAIGVASVIFVLAHVPIDFLVYKLTIPEWGLRWISSFPFAIAMGVYYHWSRNIWGPAVYHGLYDWFLGISFLEFGIGGPDLTIGQLYVLYFVWFGIIELGVLLAFSYAAYRLLWQGTRPAGSLGFKLVGVSERVRRGGKVARVHALLASRRIVAWARNLDKASFRKRETWSLAVIGMVILGNLGFSAALGVVPETEDDGPRPSDEEPYSGASETLPLETEHDYVFEGETIDYIFQGDMERRYVWVNVTLMWSDEAVNDPRYSNEADTLRVEVTLETRDGTEVIGSDSSPTGQVSIEWQAIDPPKATGILVSVTAQECGNQVPLFSPIGVRERDDNGNTFDLEVELTVVPD
jgi:membrane protease YdiL (CAAX protease family)